MLEFQVELLYITQANSWFAANMRVRTVPISIALNMKAILLFCLFMKLKQNTCLLHVNLRYISDNL